MDTNGSPHPSGLAETPLPPDPALPPRLFLSLAEVAYHLDVDRKTVMKLVAEGNLPHIKFGRIYRVPRKALEEMASPSAHRLRRMP